jgi:hypothetical protein
MVRVDSASGQWVRGRWEDNASNSIAKERRERTVREDDARDVEIVNAKGQQ